MAGRKPTRAEMKAARRRAHYLRKLREADTDTGRVGAATDYVRALLMQAPPKLRAQVAQQVVGLLLSTADALEPTEERGGRR